MVVCHAISVNCRCGAHECTGDIINILNERSEKKTCRDTPSTGQF